MPFLLVNLDDPADCRRALEQLRMHAQREPGWGPACGPGGRRGPGRGPGGGGRGPSPGPMAGLWNREPAGPPRGEQLRELPLGQKLRRIRQRGVWTHLLAIARQSEQPRSLQEWDEAIGLQPNKMRSLKAIMAKLERRFGLEFLIPANDAGMDAAGNPRYVMPARVRTVILRIADGPAPA